MRILLTAMTAVAALVALAGCVGTAPHIADHTPASTAKVATPKAKHAPDQGVAVTCSGLSELQSNLSIATLGRSAGTLRDDGYAAIINLTPTTLSGLLRTPNVGLSPDLVALQDAVNNSPSTVASTKFDPDAAPFTGALRQAAADCEKNGTPLVAYAPAGQG
ncbi:hypothetical protein [Curtobacterium sp. ISL-83]|uniref:hypothetical protein n=1 Tax=Curtobacterium sp. ISL-83 TaxID=2819145 RepID=UPI001BEA6335|nr:hypothetical protein [Curtobacterium sp. ISL-83]MBT2501061.1 hypothetical protein [Curtobacterium sp. ISL-83]